MNDSDSTAFCNVMIALAGNFSATIQEQTLDLWFDMFRADGISLGEIKQAAMHILHTRKYTKMPTYADFMQAINGNPEDKAESQANEIMREIRSVGFYGTPVFSDPITRELMSGRFSFQSMCQQAESELKWTLKTFKEAYLAYERNEKSLRIQCDAEIQKLIENIG